MRGLFPPAFLKLQPALSLLNREGRFVFRRGSSGLFSLVPSLEIPAWARPWSEILDVERAVAEAPLKFLWQIWQSESWVMEQGGGK